MENTGKYQLAGLIQLSKPWIDQEETGRAHRGHDQFQLFSQRLWEGSALAVGVAKSGDNPWEAEAVQTAGI